MCALPRSKSLRLRFSGTRLGLRFVPFPGLRSSGDQVLGERSHPHGGGGVLSTPPSQSLSFLGVKWERLRCAMCLFWVADL